MTESSALNGQDGHTGAVAVAAGDSHCLALMSDGTVIAWGDNEYGQLDVPHGLVGVAEISAGSYHSLALKSDGTVVAWGRWVDGCTDVPAGLGGVTAIAAGRDASLALKSDGTVVEWGWSFPDEAYVPSALSGVRAVAADGFSRLALTHDGSIVAWGSRVRSTEAPTGLTEVTTIGVGSSHGLALDADGTVVAWGLKDDDTVATSIKEDRGQADVPAGLVDVAAIATSGSHCLALREDGHVVAWGGETGGHLRVPQGLTDVVSIATGHGCTVALKSDGTVVVWGDAKDGQHDIPLELLAPSKASGGSTERAEHTGVVAIATGLDHSLALKEDGTVIAWGGNDSGQTDVPRDLTGVVAISASHLHSLALKADGTVVAWGYSEGGLDTDSGQNNVPLLTNVTAISAGRSSDLALKSDGSVVAWGYGGGRIDAPEGLTGVIAIAADNGLNGAGANSHLAATGDGTVVGWGTDSGSKLFWISDALTDITGLAVGHNHCVALKSDGSTLSWVIGMTNYGSSRLVATPGPTGVVAVAAGSHSVALRSDGTVVAWGSNDHGQLDVPDGLFNVVAIAAHASHSLALKEDGTIATWGTNKKGALAVPAELRAPLGRIAQTASHGHAPEQGTEPAPIVESISGQLTFLVGSDTPGDPLLTGGRSEPFPNAEALQQVLRVQRITTGALDQYAHGRVANNLAAVYMCTNRLTDALGAIQEAELKFVEMWNTNNPYPDDLLLLGLAVARYNASLLFRLAGDDERNEEYAETNRTRALDALSEMHVRSGEWKFVDRALAALGS